MTKTTSILILCILQISSVWGQVLPDPTSTLKNIEQVEKNILEQNAQEHFSPSSASAISTPSLIPQEKPCFLIKQIQVHSEKKKRYEDKEDILRPFIGKCLGTQGINVLVNRLQNHLLEQGYVTSRTLVPPQDLTTGVLQITQVDGMVGQIAFLKDTDEHAYWQNAIPLRSEEVLNIRPIEQGLDQFKRLPTVEATFEIVPTKTPAVSDVIIDWQQAKKWRISSSVDDSGSEQGGKLQGWVSFSSDHLLGFNDILSLTWRQGLKNPGGDKNTGWVFHYSFPLQYWTIAINHSQGGYKQNVQGAFIDYDYSGLTNNTDLDITRLLYRDDTQKMMGGVRIEKRTSLNYIDGVEVEVQRRKTSSFSLSFTHKKLLQKGNLESKVNYFVGTSWFGAIPAPEELFNEGTARPKIWKIQVNGDYPFQWGEASLRYKGLLVGQKTSSRLIPQNRFSIGGRWNVRGYDGENSLAAENGYFIQNTVSWNYSGNHQAYLGVDYGAVNGAAALFLVGTKLSGKVLGLKGSWGKNWNYDLFIGSPISKPAAFKTEKAFGFSLSFQM